jgi:hypothetical protein
MDLWVLALVVGGAGAIGGLVNAFISDNGFVLPKMDNGIFRPGAITNVLIGAVAAFVSWGLYGPNSQSLLVGADNTTKFTLSLAAFAGAVVVGVGGSRFLTNEVDKRFLKAAATAAVSKQANAGVAGEVANATPAQALGLVNRLT